jgi:hypothetical protein
VDGIVPKATWHWGSDSSVVSDPFGEPGHTLLYVGLLSLWTVTLCFSCMHVGGLSLGTLADIHE